MHTRIELVPQDRQSSILTIRPINRADNENRTHILGMASRYTNRCAISA